MIHQSLWNKRFKASRVLGCKKPPPGSKDDLMNMWKATTIEADQGWLRRLTKSEVENLEWVVPRFLIHQGTNPDGTSKTRLIDD